MYRLPFSDESGWSLSQGNHDDPIHGHGKFQYYAFDFAHAEDGHVRAARGGFVVDLDSTQTCNVWKIKPEDPCFGKPGKGNYVHIRHLDSTVAAYFHIKKDGVLVKKNEWVPQGKEIAYSGDTGNSSRPHLHFEVRGYWNTDNNQGPTIPIIFEDKKHIAWRPKVGDQLASNNHVNLEEGWVWCNKCQGLFKGGREFSDPSSGNCPAGGKHSKTGSSNYSLWRSSQTQTNYHRCTKCQGLFGGSGVSICGEDGGQHSQDSSPYVLLSLADIQDEWKYQTKWFTCKKCLLVFFGEITTGECPAHGHHDYTDSTNWGLIQSQFNKVQGDWRVCSRCKGLFFGSNPGSKCPAGGEHDKTGSKNYYIAINSPKYPGDHNWRWCHKCQGLFYIAWKATKCPADGGEHSSTSSATYYLDSGEEAPNEIEWRLCFNCMGLFFSGGSPQAGKCPSFPDKGHSIGTGFHNFGVMT